eukprot:7391504-Prymnesium_polylepis.1
MPLSRVLPRQMVWDRAPDAFSIIRSAASASATSPSCPWQKDGAPSSGTNDTDEGRWARSFSVIFSIAPAVRTMGTANEGLGVDGTGVVICRSVCSRLRADAFATVRSVTGATGADW